MDHFENVPVTKEDQIFSTTLWTMVLTIRSPDYAAANRALERLCQIYWRPVHAFIRRGGAPPHDAEDLTQEFFASLLINETLKKAERSRGKFRTFLLTALTNFLHNQWDKRNRLKRGGGNQIISLFDAESSYLELPGADLTPDRIFDRRWAFSLIAQARLRLQTEFDEAGKPEVFRLLEPHLTQELSAQACAGLGASLHLSEGAVRTTLHRLRRRFGEALRAEIGETVSTREEIDEEIRHLFNSVAP